MLRLLLLARLYVLHVFIYFPGVFVFNLYCIVIKLERSSGVQLLCGSNILHFTVEIINEKVIIYPWG